MKKTSGFSSLLTLGCLLLILLTTGCSKNGSNGTNGTNGANGNTILSGTTNPGSSTGNVGDFYLNLSTDMLFGPKTASGWGTGISLLGTANVIASGWNYTTNIRDSTIDGSANVIATLAAPSLTSADVTSATILVYFTFGAGVFPLPYTSYAGGKGNIMSFIPETGQIIITRFTFDNSASISLGPLNQYRFIIIPAGVTVPDAFRQAAKEGRISVIQ
jgi:hypothetical protein